VISNFDWKLRARGGDIVGQCSAQMGQKMFTNVEVFADGRMDTKNASAYSGLATQTLAIKRTNGTGPKFIKRGRIFYYREDLDEWLRAARVSSTAQARQG
jgi:hypothetical protein